jgi:hypothetical protein
MFAEDFQQCRNGTRAIAVSMLDRTESPRRKENGEVFQGPSLQSVGADARRQNGGAGTGEDRRENRLVGRQFDGDIEISIRHAECVQSLDEGGPRPRAFLS